MVSRRTYRRWGSVAAVLGAGAIAASVFGPFSLGPLLPDAGNRAPNIRPVQLASVGATESFESSSTTRTLDASPAAGALIKPLGMLISGDAIFVVDSRAGLVRRYSRIGREEAVIGAGRLKVPLFITQDYRDASLLVSDRRLRSIEVFNANGTWRQRLVPPADVGEWAPLALASAPDGLLAVTDVAVTPNRLLLVAADRLSARIIDGWDPGGGGASGAQHLSYPDAVSILADEVWVSDSNGQRLVVFGRDGVWRRTIELQGLPRGFAVLPRDVASELLGGRQGIAVAYADTTSHVVRIVDGTGRPVTAFGGSGAGVLAFPTAVVADPDGRVYVTDSGNGLVRVWGWTRAQQTAAVPRARVGMRLLPPVAAAVLLVLAAWGLSRPRAVLVTQDAEAAFAAGIDGLPARARVIHAASADLDAVVVAARSMDGAIVVDPELRRALAAAGVEVLGPKPPVAPQDLPASPGSSAEL